MITGKGGVEYIYTKLPDEFRKHFKGRGHEVRVQPSAVSTCLLPLPTAFIICAFVLHGGSDVLCDGVTLPLLSCS